jgi:protein TonB
MAHDIDLTSQRWLKLIFEDKNREYGAYVLREESSDRHLKSLLIVTVLGLALIYLPNVIKSVIPEKKIEITETSIVDLSALETEVPEEDQIKQLEAVPPPPLLKETIQFTPPVVTKDEEVSSDELMKTQQDLTESQADISIADVVGVKEGGIDIAELEGHKVIIQDEKPEIFIHVEEMPQFPGGDTELLKWLHNNLNYPLMAIEQGISGRVILRFVVKPDGSIDDIQIQKSLDPSCDNEAKRVVKKMPKWIPGKQNGNPVYVYFSLPIVFKLENSR